MNGHIAVRCMAALVLSAWIGSAFAAAAWAQGISYCDDDASCPSGSMKDEDADNTGYRTGRIGNSRYTAHTDGFRNTRGHAGNREIRTRMDGLGNTTGTIGNKAVRLHTDESGNTAGKIGDRHVRCRKNSSNQTDCD